MATSKHIKIITFLYALITLFTHLTALFLAIYRVMEKAVSQTLLSRAIELLSIGFVLWFYDHCCNFVSCKPHMCSRVFTDA